MHVVEWVILFNLGSEIFSVVVLLGSDKSERDSYKLQARWIILETGEDTFVNAWARPGHRNLSAVGQEAGSAEIACSWS